MYLGEITHYRNLYHPEFAPINYLFSRTLMIDEDIKALVLSELPAIFRKYNISLNCSDFINYFNPNDNIADVFDIEEIMDSLYSSIEKERKGALFTKEFMDFYKNVHYSNKNELIKKAINERYNYNYNMFENNRYEKFKKYLINSIPKSGFFNVEPLTEKDFNNIKMTWLYLREQSFMEYFYNVKRYYNDIPTKFLSERFFRLYNILKDRNKEIEFNNASLDRGGYSLKEKSSSLFLNDFIYEKGPKHFYKDYITYIRFEYSIYDDFPIQFSKSFGKDGWDNYNKQIYKESFKNKKMKYITIVELRDIINTLEAERLILEENGYDNAVTLLPVLFQDYFRFSLKYEKEIEFFKNSLKDTSNKTAAIYNMINYYGIENIPSELITYLTSDNFIEHKSIKKVKVYK